MMKQVFVRFHLRTATGFVSTVNVFVTKDYQRFAKSIAVRVNGAVLERTLGFFHKLAQVFTTHKGYSQKKPVHKHYAAAESMTLLNLGRRVCARRGPLLISTHSHLLLSGQNRSLKITAWEKKTLKYSVPPPPPTPPRTRWSTPWLVEWALQLKLKRSIWTASLGWVLWTVEPLETSCRHVVQAAPFSFQCSRSALPPVNCTLKPRGWPADSLWFRGGCMLYWAMVTLLCWWVLTVGTNESSCLRSGGWC